MTADARPRLQDVDARVAVGEADHLPDVDAQMLGHHRQFVGKGDVDVAIAVFDQLHHFGGAGRGGDAGAAHELAVKVIARRAQRGVMPPMQRSLSTSSTRRRPGSTRSGQWAMKMSAAPVQAPGTLRSGRSSAICAATFSVVPTGEVDSRITRLPGASTGAIARPADRTWLI